MRRKKKRTRGDGVVRHPNNGRHSCRFRERGPHRSTDDRLDGRDRCVRISHLEARQPSNSVQLDFCRPKEWIAYLSPGDDSSFDHHFRFLTKVLTAINTLESSVGRVEGDRSPRGSLPRVSRWPGLRVVRERLGRSNETSHGWSPCVLNPQFKNDKEWKPSSVSENHTHTHTRRKEKGGSYGLIVYLAIYLLTRWLSLPSSSPFKGPRTSRILAAVRQVREMTSPIRPMACASELLSQNGKRGQKVDGLAMIKTDKGGHLPDHSWCSFNHKTLKEGVWEKVIRAPTYPSLWEKNLLQIAPMSWSKSSAATVSGNQDRNVS